MLVYAMSPILALAAAQAVITARGISAAVVRAERMGPGPIAGPLGEFFVHVDFDRHDDAVEDADYACAIEEEF